MVQKHFIIYIVTVLMLIISVIYFIVAEQDYIELSQSSSSTSSSKDEDIFTRNEMIFFIIVGIAYIPVAIWMLKAKYSNIVPYTIAIIGSAALIIFYISTHTINIPSIGLQTDIGTIDIVAKVLQGAIIFLSLYTIRSVISKERH